MVELTTEGMAHGGEAVGRLAGRVVFVAGALPGERIRAELEDERRAWARARLVEVLVPSPDRREPPCPHFGHCGGCQWQFADRAHQARWKARTVREQLAHLAGADAGVVRDPLTPGPAVGYRNRLDLQVMHGRPAYFRHRSRRLEPIERCLLAAPPIADMIARLGDLGALSQITLRAGCTTEESLVIVRGPLPEAAANWDWPIARVRRGRAIAISGPSHLHERVDGVTFRITGSAFFQNNTEGAEALVTVVEEAAAVQPEDVFLDAYAGGGLFTLTVGRNAGRVLAVESAAMALSDLRYNARAAGVEVSVAAGDVVSVLGASRERWTVAVCDPPRSGLGAAGVAALVRPHPRAIVYVSCDPAVLSRDARLFADSGYELQEATPVDMFPQTYHIETVARFAPDGRNPRTGNGTL